LNINLINVTKMLKSRSLFALDRRHDSTTSTTTTSTTTQQQQQQHQRATKDKGQGTGDMEQEPPAVNSDRQQHAPSAFRFPFSIFRPGSVNFGRCLIVFKRLSK